TIRSARGTKTLAFKISPASLTGRYGRLFFCLQRLTAVETKTTIGGIFCLASITAHRAFLYGLNSATTPDLSAGSLLYYPPDATRGL
ncbi:MAG: hypothetical protein ACYCY2_12700, partial [Acidithiobacillus ferriphilus]